MLIQTCMFWFFLWKINTCKTSLNYFNIAKTLLIETIFSYCNDVKNHCFTPFQCGLSTEQWNPLTCTFIVPNPEGHTCIGW